MNQSDKDKIDFIKTNVQVETLVNILFMIDRGELVKCIEMVPENERNDPNFKILRRTLDFWDGVTEEQVNANING